MSVLTSTPQTAAGADWHHLHRTVAALRAALSAFRERRAAAADAREFESLCRSYEALTPNLANELRFMASRR